jgi:hypothetical protein
VLFFFDIITCDDVYYGGQAKNWNAKKNHPI